MTGIFTLTTHVWLPHGPSKRGAQVRFEEKSGKKKEVQASGAKV